MDPTVRFLRCGGYGWCGLFHPLRERPLHETEKGEGMCTLGGGDYLGHILGWKVPAH